MSLTITEGGYLLDEHGAFNLKHPTVTHDLQHPGSPQGAFGYLVEALDRRRKAGVKPFTVLSCDNLRHNGDQARRAVVSFAQARDAELAAWIEREVAFPNGMVDLEPVMQSTSPMRLLSIKEVVGSKIPAHQGFVELYLKLRKQLDEQGVEATLKSLDPAREAPAAAKA